VRDRLCQLIRQHQLDATLVKSYATDFCGVKTLRDAQSDKCVTKVSTCSRVAAYFRCLSLHLRMRKWGGQDKFLSALPRPSAGPNAVEKLHPQKMPEKTLQSEALQTTFSVFLDIFHPPNFGCFAEN